MKLDKPIEEIENRIEVRELQNSLANKTIEDLEPLVQKRREEFSKELDKIYQLVKQNTKKPTKEAEGSKPQLNAMIISELLFKPISSLYSSRPAYTPEKLQIAFELYRDMIVQCNLKGFKTIPTKSHFCRFCGFSTSTYDSYLDSSDLGMRNLMEVIDDYFFDTNITSAQTRDLELATTMFRSKVEQKRVEAVPVQNHVVTVDADIDKIMYDIGRLKEGKKVIDYDTIEGHFTEYNETKKLDTKRPSKGNK